MAEAAESFSEAEQKDIEAAMAEHKELCEIGSDWELYKLQKALPLFERTVQNMQKKFAVIEGMRAELDANRLAYAIRKGFLSQDGKMKFPRGGWPKCAERTKRDELEKKMAVAHATLQIYDAKGLERVMSMTKEQVEKRQRDDRESQRKREREMRTGSTVQQTIGGAGGALATGTSRNATNNQASRSTSNHQASNSRAPGQVSTFTDAASATGDSASAIGGSGGGSDGGGSHGDEEDEFVVSGKKDGKGLAKRQKDFFITVKSTCKEARNGWGEMIFRHTSQKADLDTLGVCPIIDMYLPRAFPGLCNPACPHCKKWNTETNGFTNLRRAWGTTEAAFFFGMKMKCKDCKKTFQSYDPDSLRMYERDDKTCYAVANLPVTIFNKHNAWKTEDYHFITALTSKGISFRGLAKLVKEGINHEFDRKRLAM